MPTDQLDLTFAALADPTRRAILERLAAGEATVSELTEPFPVSVQAVSKHLKVLEGAGLITRGRTAQLRPSGSTGRHCGRRRSGSTATGASGSAASSEWSVACMAERPDIEMNWTFDAPRERVWREWTDPEAFADWYGGPEYVIAPDE